jgi:hypothetical protein
LAASPCGIVDGEGATLAGDEFRGAEIDELDYTIVVEEDVCIELARGKNEEME